MIPHRVARRAQALIIYKLAKGEAFTPEWLVNALERMDGVTPHTADQAAAMALASPATVEARARAEQHAHWMNHPADLAAALRAEIRRLDELERKTLEL